jgi:hypothetical protein
MRACILFLICLLFYVGCRSEPGTITIILPNNYEGYILISEDKQNGQDLTWANGACVLHIPENGRVALKDYNTFGKWHKIKVMYENGNEVPYMNPTSADQIAFYDLQYVHGVGSYAIVGTADDYKKAHYDVDFGNPEIGNKNLTPAKP